MSLATAVPSSDTVHMVVPSIGYTDSIIVKAYGLLSVIIANANQTTATTAIASELTTSINEFVALLPAIKQSLLTCINCTDKSDQQSSNANNLSSSKASNASNPISLSASNPLSNSSSASLSNWECALLFQLLNDALIAMNQLSSSSNASSSMLLPSAVVCLCRALDVFEDERLLAFEDC